LCFLTILDEYTRECLAFEVAWNLTSEDVLDQLTEPFVNLGIPAYIRSDNGLVFTAGRVRAWLSRLGVKTLYFIYNLYNRITCAFT
jgi:transposase InsO family protein